ncbi:MAG: carbohydrate kinase family protein [Pseudomonadota bacterium]
MSVGNVLVLGAASWNRMVYVDDLPQGVSATIPDAREVENVGSTGVGKAMTLAGLGCRPVLHCALGRDHHGERVADACTARGIDLIVDAQDAPTQHHLNIMDRRGGRYSMFLSNGAADPVIDAARIAERIRTAETIFLSLSTSSKKVLPLLTETGAEVLLDLHDYDGRNPWYDDFIATADVVQLSDVSLPDPAPVIERLLAGRARQVVLTKAENGAEIFSGDHAVSVQRCPAEMVDSNGAGDAFSVALWYGQRTGLGLEEAGRFAASAAAFAVESPTLFPSDIAVDDIRRRAGMA